MLERERSVDGADSKRPFRGRSVTMLGKSGRTARLRAGVARAMVIPGVRGIEDDGSGGLRSSSEREMNVG